MVDALPPGGECDVSVPMNSPKTPGMYQGQWRMSSPTGPLFGGNTCCGNITKLALWCVMLVNQIIRINADK